MAVEKQRRRPLLSGRLLIHLENTMLTPLFPTPAGEDRRDGSQAGQEGFEWQQKSRTEAQGARHRLRASGRHHAIITSAAAYPF